MRWKRSTQIDADRWWSLVTTAVHKFCESNCFKVATNNDFNQLVMSSVRNTHTHRYSYIIYQEARSQRDFCGFFVSAFVYICHLRHQSMHKHTNVLMCIHIYMYKTHIHKRVDVSSQQASVAIISRRNMWMLKKQ